VRRQPSLLHLVTRYLLLQLELRVRVEIMGSKKCGIVGESQSILSMIDPMIIFTRSRSSVLCRCRCNTAVRTCTHMYLQSHIGQRFG
jgi:hypothetical protein